MCNTLNTCILLWFMFVQKCNTTHFNYSPTGVLPGHIPGSKCMPFLQFLDEGGMMLSTEELKRFFQKSQVDLNKPICGVCGSGVTACHMVLASHLCGYPGATIYDGSWYEWFTKAPAEHIVSEAKSKQ